MWATIFLVLYISYFLETFSSCAMIIGYDYGLRLWAMIMGYDSGLRFWATILGATFLFEFVLDIL